MAITCGYQSSVGVSLMRLDEAGGASLWELVGGVLELPQLSISAGVSQCDDFDSGISGFEEYFKNGKFSIPELPMSLGMIPDNPVQEKIYQDVRRVNDDVGGKALVGWRIVIPTPTVTTLEFSAFAIAYGWNITRPSAEDNKISHPITLRPSGDLTRVV